MHNKDTLYHILMSTAKRAFNRNHDVLQQVGLYRGQPPIMFALWRQDGLSRTELSEIVNSRPATITKTIQRLENNEFVISRADQVDSRVSRVYLTDHGRLIEGEINRIFSDLQEEMFDGFSDEELDQLSCLLQKVQNNLPKGCHEQKRGLGGGGRKCGRS